MTQLRLPVGSARLRSRAASSARLVNCYAEQLPPDAKSPIVVQRSEGVVSFAEVGTGPIYGMIAALGDVYVISGAELYVLFSSGASSLIGNIGTGASIQNCDLAANTTSLVVVNNPAAYYYTPGGPTFAQITDADFRGASDVEFLSNYLLFVDPDSGVFFGADFGSPSSFDALEFATAETATDDLVGLQADHVQALLFGSDSVEIWDDDPSAGSFPFRRAANGFVELGCLNGRTIAKLDNSVFWLASDYTIRRLSGATPQRVSNHAFEQFLASIEVASASAYAYSRGGHLFYVLTCNQGTWVHDVTTGEPHERQTYGRDFWRWATTCNAYGLQLVGDITSNKVGYLDATVYDELDDTMRSEATFQPVFKEGNCAFHDRFEALIETGVGLTDGQGIDPQIMLSWSDDGGENFFNAPNRSLGKIGKRETRVSWSGLGSCRSANGRVYRLAVSDPVPFNLTGALLDGRGVRL